MFTFTDIVENIAGSVQTARYEQSDFPSTVFNCLLYWVQGNRVLWYKGLNKLSRDFFVNTLFFRFNNYEQERLKTQANNYINLKDTFSKHL